MYGGLTDLLKPLLLAVLLFGALGWIASYGYFFWKNKEMSPCAAAGLEGAETLEVAEPYSRDRIVKRATIFGVAAGGLGLLVGLIALCPRLRRSSDRLRE